MYKRYLSNYIIKEKVSIYEAHWKLYKNNAILLVVDEKDKFVGVISFVDIKKTYDDENLSVKDICNRDCKYLLQDMDCYTKAKVMFETYKTMHYIPIIDEERNIVDLLSRTRVYWKDYYDKAELPRMHYAYCIWTAALEAKCLGYETISVIEFGVAGGSGLINCEFHAKEVSRILDIDIEVYGFDSAQGLPYQNMGYKDLVHIWPGGSYHMDREKLEQRLEYAKLIIGDLKETTKEFIKNYKFAPIGCMLIDVDYYSSTVPILEMLETNDELLLPRVYMYFDDIGAEYEFQGEYLAIKEFNQKHELVKISPERMYYTDYRARVKIGHKFNHKKYNDYTSVFMERKLLEADYELKLKDYI